MHLIKSISNQTILFDEKEILIFNDQYITKYERLIIALLGIGLAISGIVFHVRDETLFFLIAYILLLVVWGGYFLSYLFQKKNPVQIKYLDLIKIKFKLSKRKQIINIIIKDKPHPISIKTKHIDSEMIEFLNKKSLVIEIVNSNS